MNPAQAIATAAIPDIHYVLGVALRPYSIGHWLLLTRAGVSFVTNGGEHKHGDLLAAVLLCSRSYSDGVAILQSGEIERESIKLTRKLRGWKFFQRKTVSEIVGFDFQSSCSFFQNYIDQHGGGIFRVNGWSSPITSSKSGSDCEMGAPEPMLLLDSLVSSGFSLSDALDMPIPFARWLWAVGAERKRFISIIDEDVALADKLAADEFARKVFAGGV